MPQVVREDIDNLNAVLTVSIPKDDYLPLFNTELRKYRKDARIKGFRQGKTPTGVLKKMFGKAVLGEIINKMLQEQLTDFMVNDPVEILGQPIPSDAQEPVEFDVKDLQDYTFKFDIGLAPIFEVEGLDSDAYEKYAVEIPAEMVEDEVQNLLQRNGDQVFPEDGIEDKDIVTFDVIELDGDKPKENGITHEFGVLVERMEDDMKKAVLKMKLGDELKLNPFQLEKDTTEKYVRKYFLGLEEAEEGTEEVAVGDQFQAEITKISRVNKAELNQDFFDKVFGPEQVSTEEEFKAKLSENMSKTYDSQAEALLFRDIQQRLLDSNELALPEDFLKRWLAMSNENVSPEVLDKEFPAFANNLRWTLIRSKLNKAFEIEVSPEEVKESFKNKIRGYFGGAGVTPDMESMVESMAERMLQDEKQVNEIYEEVSSNKFFEAVVEKVAVTDKSITIEDFQAVIQKIEEERAAEQAAQLGEEE